MPAVGHGAVYKYAVASEQGEQHRADPVAAFAELTPRTASRVWDLTGYDCGATGRGWPAAGPAAAHLDAPVSSYEVHLGSWSRGVEDGNRFLTYRELADQLVEHLRTTGFTHVELLPINEHPFDG